MDKEYYLIGIGGIGMSGIARLLLRRGIKVFGSDIKETRITDELKSLGAQVFIGHNPENIRNAKLVIYSSAIGLDNPEIKEAKRLNLPLIRRAEALSQLMQEKSVITVAGSHGKTTTTSLVSFLLLEAGLRPTVAIGGILKNIDANACLGDGEYFVAEADESDGSFLCYRPKYSIITNIDREHLDYYQEFAKEVDAFRDFLQRTEADGCVFCCADDPNLKKLIADYQHKTILFGLQEDAQIHPKNIKLKGLSCEFDCFLEDKALGNFRLALGGMHNISNALAVIALGLELRIDLALIKKVLQNYSGAKRRLEVKLDKNGYLVVDDYAHHPTEIIATLSALKNCKAKRLIGVFQPHRYSRTKLLLDDFSRCFSALDELIITDIYPAGEQPIKGIDPHFLIEQIKQNSVLQEVIYLAKDEIAPYILKVIRPDDILITLGAGDITKISDELASQLQGKS